MKTYLNRTQIITAIATAIEGKPSYVATDLKRLVDDLENGRDIRESLLAHIPNAEVAECYDLLSGENTDDVIVACYRRNLGVESLRKAVDTNLNDVFVSNFKGLRIVIDQDKTTLRVTDGAGEIEEIEINEDFDFTHVSGPDLTAEWSDDEWDILRVEIEIAGNEVTPV